MRHFGLRTASKDSVLQIDIARTSGRSRFYEVFNVAFDRCTQSFFIFVFQAGALSSFSSSLYYDYQQSYLIPHSQLFSRLAALASKTSR